jgi:hypothetical protein
MLNLKLLDYFDYAGKIDNDVSFMKAFPETNLPLRMAAKEAKMLVTQKQWYYDDPRIANGVEWCLHNYMQEESKLCGGVGGDAKALPVPPNDCTYSVPCPCLPSFLLFLFPSASLGLLLPACLSAFSDTT